MRKTVLVACLAAIGGFCLASATAFAVARYNIWRASGPQFQLGYVIGYLDAIALSQRHDTRASIPTRMGKNFDRWMTGIYAYFEKPENQEREVADAIYAVGQKMQEEYLREWGKKVLGRAVATPFPTPSP